MLKNFYLKKSRILLFALLCFLSHEIYAQQSNGNPCNQSSTYLYWTGEENNNFFNENNWRVAVERPSGPNGQLSCLPGSNSFPYTICPRLHNNGNDRHPKAGDVDPDVPIRYNLLIDTATVMANGNIVFACGQKGITLRHTQLDMIGGTLSQGVLSLMNESTVHFRAGSLSSNLFLNYLDAASWVSAQAKSG